MRSRSKARNVEPTLQVFVVETFYHHTGVYESGNQYELPIAWALREIEAGRCVPVLPEYRSIASSFRGPSGPLPTVFRVYHLQFAQANPITWLDRPLQIGEFNRVYLWFYAKTPRWTKLGEYKSREEVKENYYSMLTGNGRLERIVTLEQRFDRTLRDLRDRYAIHDFLRFLLGETHTTTGIPSANHYDFETKKVHRETWKFNVSIDLDANELNRHEKGRRDQYEPFWRATHVQCHSEDDTLARFLRMKKTPRKAGRPSSMPLIKAEFRRRAMKGQIEPSLRKQAQTLSSWLDENHPDETKCGASRIETVLRKEYWTARSKLQANP